MPKAHVEETEIFATCYLCGKVETVKDVFQSIHAYECDDCKRDDIYFSFEDTNEIQ